MSILQRDEKPVFNLTVWFGVTIKNATHKLSLDFRGHISKEYLLNFIKGKYEKYKKLHNIKKANEMAQIYKAVKTIEVKDTGRFKGKLTAPGLVSRTIEIEKDPHSGLGKYINIKGKPSNAFGKLH